MSTLTLKAGTGYDVPWFVSDETDLKKHRENMLSFVGLDEDATDEHGNKISEMPLAQVVALCNELFHGMYALYATAAGSGRSWPGKTQAKVEAKPVEKKDEVDEFEAEALKYIESVDNTEELKKFFIQNKAQIEKAPKVMSALQAKFKK